MFSKGGGDSLAYRAASDTEIGVGPASNAAAAQENLVWILIARHSPLKHSELLELSQLEPRAVDEALAQLVADGRVTRSPAAASHQPRVGATDEAEYTSGECVIPFGQSAGWEASVFDHYQAVVTAICAKLAAGSATAVRQEEIGGSTYSY